MRAVCVLKINNIAYFYLEDGQVYRTKTADIMHAGLRQRDTGEIYEVNDRGTHKVKFKLDAEDADYIFYRCPSKALTIFQG